MLPEEQCDRQLDTIFDEVIDAARAETAMLTALDRLIPAEDWEDYERYLDRLDLQREYPPPTSPAWTAFLRRVHLPDDDPEDVF